MAEKYHIGKNGPDVCRAEKRACKYAATDGTKEEVEALWAKQMAEEHGDKLLAGVNRQAAATLAPNSTGVIGVSSENSRGESSAASSLSDRAKYEPISPSVSYSDEERAMAMRIGLSNVSELSSTPFDRFDESFNSGGFSNVKKVILKDGSVGYFKGFADNSLHESNFVTYGTSSMGASINEVNSYRMAKAMGRSFEALVPETVFREVDGKLGTLQREVEFELPPASGVDRLVSKVDEDSKRAAIFDFVTGNQDRHGGNFLKDFEPVPKEEGVYHMRLRLIDNSFSFPAEENLRYFNRSQFTDSTVNELSNGEKKRLTVADRNALKRARSAVDSWLEEGTISKAQGEGALKRIGMLEARGRLLSYSDHLYYLPSGGDGD